MLHIMVVLLKNGRVGTKILMLLRLLFIYFRNEKLTYYYARYFEIIDNNDSRVQPKKLSLGF